VNQVGKTIARNAMKANRSLLSRQSQNGNIALRFNANKPREALASEPDNRVPVTELTSQNPVETPDQMGDSTQCSIGGEGGEMWDAGRQRAGGKE